MPHRTSRLLETLVLAIGIALAAPACDRNIEPFVPGEQPEVPDLSRIFPEAASESAAQASGGSGMPGAPAPRGEPPAAAAGADAEPIRGRVDLAPDLAKRASADAVLFLIARPGPAGPPLAVKRIASPRFPLDFEIGPADRMIQAMPFVGPLQLSARLDGDGNASTRAPGDLQGAAPGTYQPGAAGVTILLDQIL